MEFATPNTLTTCLCLDVTAAAVALRVVCSANVLLQYSAVLAAIAHADNQPATSCILLAVDDQFTETFALEIDPRVHLVSFLVRPKFDEPRMPEGSIRRLFMVQHLDPRH